MHDIFFSKRKYGRILDLPSAGVFFLCCSANENERMKARILLGKRRPEPRAKPALPQDDHTCAAPLPNSHFRSFCLFFPSRSFHCNIRVFFSNGGCLRLEMHSGDLIWSPAPRWEKNPLPSAARRALPLIFPWRSPSLLSQKRR